MRPEAIFEVETPLGYKAVLRMSNWERHKLRHPELTGQEENVAATLGSPDVVVETSDGCHHYYCFGLGTGKFADCYLHPLVRQFATDAPGDRTVVSAWFTKVLEKGNIIWLRKKLS